MRISRVLIAALALLAGCGVPSAAPRPADTVALTAASPYGHVFVIVLENEDAGETFGATSPAIYLNRWVRPRSVFVPNYYGIGHHSLGNYLAMISGQAPNTKTQYDCHSFSGFASTARIGANGQISGSGCVYPASVPTVAGQLTAAGRTWRGYMDGMQRNCQRPALGAQDPNQGATQQTAYATKHNPFVYFGSISPTACAANDVPLWRLPTDLGAVSTTRNLSYIVPDLCHDGHDSPCAYGRGPGGLKSADAFLQTWVPKILNSPAYKQDGLLIITFDEAETDARACCHEVPGPGASMPGISGPGGGRVGAVMMSPKLAPMTVTGAYNHYSFLATIEHIFGLPRLGFAASAAPLA